jgi:signal transduction histidine kinase
MIAQASNQVERVIASLQGLITELRPASLDQLGIGAALEALVDRMQVRTGLEVDLDVRLAYDLGHEPTRLAPELEAAVYRVAQEALTNVVKHADAGRARVVILESGDRIDLTVEDDGVGLEERPQGLRDDGGGFGLVGMQERIELLNGELAMESPEGGGTRVHATFPAIRAEPPSGSALAS